MRKLLRLVLVLTVTMLFGSLTYALDNHDPTFDLVPLTLDIGLPTADADLSDVDTSDFTYTIETDPTPLARYSEISRYSKPATDSQTAAIAVHRLKYEVPWQYWQA